MHLVTRDVLNASDNAIYLLHGNISETDIESFILNFSKQGSWKKYWVKL